jgi:hypothetical protein
MNVRKMFAVLTLAFALFFTVGASAQTKDTKKAPAKTGGDAKPAAKKGHKKGHKKSHKKSSHKKSGKKAGSGDTKAPAKTPAKKKS